MKEAGQVKRPYRAPEAYRVELHHEQAVLSGRATTASSPSNNGGNGCRPPGPCDFFGAAGCKSSSLGGGCINSGAAS